MNVKVEKTDNANELKLSFEVEAKKFDEAMVSVYNKSAKYINNICFFFLLSISITVLKIFI